VTRRLALAALLVCAACGRQEARSGKPAGPEVAAFRMVDVTADSGVTFVSRSGDAQRFIPEAKGTGVAILDYDRDGVLDLFFVSGSTIERQREGKPGFGAALYRGLGGLRYEDVTARASVPELGWMGAPVAGDLDGDGFDDLLITGVSGIRVLKNQAGRFRDVTASALPDPLARAGWCASAALFDLDGDDDLDVFVARYLDFDFSEPPEDGKGGRSCRWKGRPAICGPRGLEPLHDLLLRNRGDGTFESVGARFGLESVPAAYGLGVLPFDFNRDGRIDVYVANDMTPSHLWRNDGDRFSEVGVGVGLAYSADGAPEAGMGVDAADVNGDGVEDILKTNFEGEPNDVYLSSPKVGFEEASARVGTAAADRPHVGWGCAMRDFDGDGLTDLFVANGHVYPDADLPATGTTYAQPKVLHLGVAGGRFARFTGAGSEALGTPKVSRAAAFGDLDDDGDTDVVVVNLNDRPTILRSDVPRGNWVGIAVSGPRGNPRALGATVTIRGPGFARSALVRAQSSFQSSNDARVLFRLRDSERPASVEIALRGHATRTHEPVQPGAYHELAVE
jgi:hypothetical protein